MFCAVLLIVTPGCDAPSGGKDPFAWLKPKPKENSANQTAEDRAAQGMEMVARMTGSDNGLAIRKWIVEDNEGRIASVLMRHAEGAGEVLHDTADKRLQRNGFRLLRVSADDLPDILQELGGASLDVTAWHGQVYDWRAVATHGIGGAGQPLAIDGRIKVYPAGEMRLVMRSWIVPMETGPFVQFELVPQYHQPQRRDLNLLAGREQPPPIESFPSMAVDQLLEAGSAYVLTCAPPQSDWTTYDIDPNVLDAPPADVAQPVESAPATAKDTKPPAPPSMRRAGGVGPADLVGPDAVAPQTIGQWMFTTDVGRPSRIILVLLPRISNDLYPSQVSAP